MRRIILSSIAIFVVAGSMLIGYMTYSKDERAWSAEKKAKARIDCARQYGTKGYEAPLAKCLREIPDDGDWFRFRHK